MAEYVISEAGLAAAFDHGSEAGEFASLPAETRAALIASVHADPILYVLSEADLETAFDDDGHEGEYVDLEEGDRVSLRSYAERYLAGWAEGGSWAEALQYAVEEWEDGQD